jgi:protein-S-isoprenylcysteine O-methyltransferase Ste14
VSGERKFWMRWRVRLGYPAAVIYWVLAMPQPRMIAIGTVIAFFGLLIRALAAGHLTKNEELTTSGLYAQTRNPLYLGSSLLAAGFAIAGDSVIAGGIVVMYFAVFYYAVMRNEEQELRARYGSAFESYAARVPLFLPSMFSEAAKPEGEQPVRQFSWAQYRRNREYRALIGTIFALGMVWARMWVPAAWMHLHF